ncbi:MAG: hypothetical protein P8045_12360 [Candidatus Thiodiazotropha sp.]|jgi:hypothetical protein
MYWNVFDSISKFTLSTLLAFSFSSTCLRASQDPAIEAVKRHDYLAAEAEWLRQVGRGDPRVMHNLGALYIYGQYGITTQIDKGTSYFRRAAGLGFGPSQITMSFLYETGLCKRLIMEGIYEDDQLDEVCVIRSNLWKEDAERKGYEEYNNEASIFYDGKPLPEPQDTTIIAAPVQRPTAPIQKPHQETTRSRSSNTMTSSQGKKEMSAGEVAGGVVALGALLWALSDSGSTNDNTPAQTSSTDDACRINARARIAFCYVTQTGCESWGQCHYDVDCDSGPAGGSVGGCEGSVRANAQNAGPWNVYCDPENRWHINRKLEKVVDLACE